MTFNLSQIPSGQRQEALNQVGEFLVDSILNRVADGKSPVSGETFKQLKAGYAEREKGGDRTPNLELTGDMLDSLTFKTTADGVEVGYFKDSASEFTLAKADGHNNFTGKSRIPTRRFIPGEDQDFIRSITSEVYSILEEFHAESIPDEIDFVPPSDKSTSVNLNNIFDRDILRRLFGES